MDLVAKHSFGTADEESITLILVQGVFWCPKLHYRWRDDVPEELGLIP